jgi:hypothetical protein
MWCIATKSDKYPMLDSIGASLWGKYCGVRR